MQRKTESHRENREREKATEKDTQMHDSLEAHSPVCIRPRLALLIKISQCRATLVFGKYHPTLAPFIREFVAFYGHRISAQ